MAITAPKPPLWLRLTHWMISPWAITLWVALIIGGIGYWFWTQEAHNPAAPALANRPDPNIDLRFVNAELRGRKNGQPQWMMKAKELEISRDGRYANFKKDPSGNFINIKDWNKPEPSPGMPPAMERLRSVTWSAKKADYDMVTEELSIEGAVKITTDEQDTVTTERATVQAKDERVTAHRRVKIVAKKGYPIVEANEMKADAKMETMELNGNVSIDTQLDESQEL